MTAAEATRFDDPPAWVADAVFYQIFPDRFASSERVPKPGPLEPWDAPPTHHGFKGGDLLGIVERLDHLSSLGITALYLTPIFTSASNHRYHTFDYYKVDPLLGGDQALRELLDAAHGRGMRVLLDGVFNHSGRGFWPFHHVVENGAQSPYVGWFHLDHEVLRSGRLRPYPSPEELRDLEEAGKPSRDGTVSQRRLGYRAWWDRPALPKLNTDNPHMREHLMGAAEHWLRFGIDGWRLDVAEEIDAGFWREFRARVRAINPEAYLVAEIWRERPHWLTGDTFDALMNYPLVEALLSFTAARQLDMEVVAAQHEYSVFVRPLDGPGFAERLGQLMTVYRPQVAASQLNLLGSHDTARYLTVAGGDVASLRLGLLALMTLPGAPCVYYGDEIGMAGRLDPDCRRALPWDESRWDTELLAYSQATIAMRHANHVLRHGTFRVLAAEGDAVAFGRFSDDGAAVVALNAGDGPAVLSFLFDGDVQAVVLPGWDAPQAESSDGRLSLTVGPRSGAVLMGGSS